MAPFAPFNMKQPVLESDIRLSSLVFLVGLLTTLSVTNSSAVKQPTLSGSKATAEDIQHYKSTSNLHNFSYIIQPDLCDTDTELLLSFHSAATYRDRRDLIRFAWASPSLMHSTTGMKTKVIFILGYDPHQRYTLLYEAEQYKDILQMDFIEDYRNNTFKALYHFRWVHENCRKVKLVMKCDDDMLLHPTKLQRQMFPLVKSAMQKSDRFYMGGMEYGDAHRNPKSPWFVPWHVYPYVGYPEFSFGACYFLSSNIMLELFNASFTTPYLFMDDVYLGMLVYKIGNVSNTNLIRMYPPTRQKVHQLPYTELERQWMSKNDYLIFHMPRKDYFYLLWQSWVEKNDV